jgi:hypothetical protein
MSGNPSNAGLMVGGPDPEVMAAIERGNAVVFFDVALGEGANSAELGRIKVELFVKDVSRIVTFITCNMTLNAYMSDISMQ